MRKIIFICFTLLLINCNAQKKVNYFYLDAICQQCKQPNNKKEHGIYVITDQNYLGILNKNNIEKHINNFKIQISKTFENPEILLKNIVLRKLDNEFEVGKSRNRNIRKYGKKGFLVHELSLKTENHKINLQAEKYLRHIEKFGFSGSVLIAEKGKIIHENYYGWLNPKLKLINSKGALFNIGSIAKPFTSQAILLLVNQKKIELTTTLEEIFLNVPKDKQKVTIHQLLTHTSGYKRNIIDVDEKVSSFEDAKRRIIYQPLSFKPSEKYNYSNAGYQLLGLIVEEISKMPLDIFLKQQILNPNKIEKVQFFHDFSNKKNIALSMNEWSSEEFTPFKNRQYSNLSSTGILANTRGIYRWFCALKKNKAMFNLMSKSQIKDGNLSYGFFIKKNSKTIYSSGDHGDYHSLLTYDKSLDRLIIILSNTSLYNFGVHRNLILNELTNILKDNTPKKYLKSSLINSDLSIEGYYKNDEFELSINTYNNQLKLLLSNQQTINYFFSPDSSKLESIKNKRIALNNIANSIRAKKFNKLNEWLNDFHSNIFIEDYEYFTNEHGKLMNVQVIGTIPLPWKSPNYESLIILTYGTKKIDFRIVWNEDKIYETLTETNHPSGFITHLAKTNDNNWIAYDFITNELNKFSIEKGKSKTTILLDSKKNFSHKLMLIEKQ
jgi:CubicO group peptidase (beta-lactamase class C family)